LGGGGRRKCEENCVGVKKEEGNDCLLPPPMATKLATRFFFTFDL
jgi:hypothetical protein